MEILLKKKKKKKKKKKVIKMVSLNNDSNVFNDLNTILLFIKKLNINKFYISKKFSHKHLFFFLFLKLRIINKP